MRVSVVIPVRNDARGLGLCLEALAHQDLPHNDFEVIVVDNGSSDDIGEVKAAFPGIRWLFDSGPGSYSARNAGWKGAEGGIIAFTDSDCLPEKGWLREMVAGLDNAGASLAGGRIDYLNPEGRTLNVYEIFEERVFLLGKHRELVERRGMAATANLAARREVFDRVGGFDPALKSYGDGAWVQKAVKAGERLAYIDSAVVRHPRRGTFGQVYRKCIRLVGGRMSILRKQNAPIGRRMMEVYRNSPLDWRSYALACSPRAGGRFHFAALVMFISAATTCEKLRVLSGGDPSRGA